MFNNIIDKCDIFYKLATEVSGVQPFRQTPGLCGAASLHIVLKFHGIEVSEKILAKLSKTTQSGTEAPEMLQAVRKFDFDGFYLDDCEISDIKRWLDKGFPVIVDWFSTDEGHFSVVYKIDEKNIYMQDPELGHARSISLDTFSKVWFDFKNSKQKDLTRRRIIIIYPKDKKPELNDEEKKAVSRNDYVESGAREKVSVDKKPMFTFKGFKFVLVDAEKIRNTVDIDFVAGGNPARYQYVPKDEIWIESTMSLNDIAATSLHELVECILMSKKGYDYNGAHEMAAKVEQKLRNKFKSKKITNTDQIETILESLSS